MSKTRAILDKMYALLPFNVFIVRFTRELLYRELESDRWADDGGK
jgi:hypothetical protein